MCTNYWDFCSKLSKFAIVVRLYFPTSLAIVSINSQVILAVIILHLSATGDIRGNLDFAGVTEPCINVYGCVCVYICTKFVHQ